MKTLIIFFLMAFYSSNVFSLCDSVISRTNNSANSVLTSTKYNLDHNTAYTRLNELPGDCVTDATLDYAKLDTTNAGFANLVKSNREGCKVSYSDSDTLSVGVCRMGINGNQVLSTSAVNVTWGCANCSSQAASTTYYLYMDTASDGDSVDLVISTSAPDGKGESSNDKVLARFYNDSSQNIDQYSIDQWNGRDFTPQKTGWITDSAGLTINATTTAPTKGGTASFDNVRYRRVGKNMEVQISYFKLGSNGNTNGSGDYLFKVPNGYKIDLDASGLVAEQTAIGNGSFDMKSATGNTAMTNSTFYSLGRAMVYDEENVRSCVQVISSSSQLIGCFASGLVGFSADDLGLHFQYSVPILGWSN